MFRLIRGSRHRRSHRERPPIFRVLSCGCNVHLRDRTRHSAACRQRTSPDRASALAGPHIRGGHDGHRAVVQRPSAVEQPVGIASIADQSQHGCRFPRTGTCIRRDFRERRRSSIRRGASFRIHRFSTPQGRQSAKRRRHPWRSGLGRCHRARAAAGVQRAPAPGIRSRRLDIEPAPGHAASPQRQPSCVAQAGIRRKDAPHLRAPGTALGERLSRFRLGGGARLVGAAISRRLPAARRRASPHRDRLCDDREPARSAARHRVVHSLLAGSPPWASWHLPRCRSSISARLRS